MSVLSSYSCRKVKIVPIILLYTGKKVCCGQSTQLHWCVYYICEFQSKGSFRCAYGWCCSDRFDGRLFSMHDLLYHGFFLLLRRLIVRLTIESEMITGNLSVCLYMPWFNSQGYLDRSWVLAALIYRPTLVENALTERQMDSCRWLGYSYVTTRSCISRGVDPVK